MEVAVKTYLPDVFKALYSEFVDYLNKTGLSNRVLVVNDGKPIIGFQYAISSMGGIEDALKQLTSLPSYRELVSLTAQIQNVTEQEVEKSRYGLFCYIFSDVANCVNPPQVSYHISNVGGLSDFELDEQRLSNAILHATNAAGCIQRTNKYLIIFENLNVQSNIKINDDINLIKLSQDEVNAKLKARYDPGNMWSRVFSAFEIGDRFLSNKELIPVLSTLVRLYKTGDVRFKGIYQAANHIIRGEIYVNYKYSFSEIDYYENAPAVKDDVWRQYSIIEEEREDFSDFIGRNLATMLSMSHSCQMYNLVNSSPLQLKIPLLFFVIESFFADVQSEVSFRVPLYVTNLLDENDSFRKTLKKLYDVRSKVAHGDLVAARKLIGIIYSSGGISFNGFSGASEHLDLIVKRLWMKLLAINWNQKNSADLITNYLLRINNKEV